MSGSTITGADSADILSGAAGEDSLSGGAGADTISGGLGRDTITSGAGADVILIGRGHSGVTEASADVVLDWQPGDLLTFGGAHIPITFLSRTAGSFDFALRTASDNIGAGFANFVVVEVGSDTIVFADTANLNAVTEAVILRGVSSSGFGPGNLRSGLTPPSPPPITPQDAYGDIHGSMDAIQLSDLIGGEIFQATPTFLNIGGGPGRLGVALFGTGFTYDVDDQLTGGVVTRINLFRLEGLPTDFYANLNLDSVSAAPFMTWVLTNATATALAALLGGGDSLFGARSDDLIRGFGGDDRIWGLGGADSLFGGAGNDQIVARYIPPYSASTGTGSSYLRGEDGDDYVIGGLSFDDVHGNAGSDTCLGSADGDWVVGGKGDDLLFGDGLTEGSAGADVVLGNLGNDTCVGGPGNDVLRGGQADDVVWGEDGDDWVSGDRGTDVLSGGAGADNFHVFDGSGVDRVIDFDAAEGDRVWLLPGSQWSAAQVGADTVVTVTGAEGGQLVLVGVQLSSLPSGWIFGA